MKSQTLIAVHDVEASSQWYQAVLGLKSGHGGPEYERLLAEEQLVLQLHRWDPNEHPYLGEARAAKAGDGVVLWFQVEDIEAAYARATSAAAEILESLKVNPNANHREFWLRDPDGYVVVVAGRWSDVG
jgi:catechol 2,3-dioxygenase-like lactoylglutathione lyase family enzyme